jgi:tripartite-type tricarboxylate transporter receptor subunit TctC
MVAKNQGAIMAVRVSRWISAALVLAATGSVAAILLAAAEEYPVRPVRIVVGFTAGSSGDVAARVPAQQLGARFGQQFVIENRTGAGSNIATYYVAHASRDGYTLLQATVANTLAAATMSNLNFDVVKTDRLVHHTTQHRRRAPIDRCDEHQGPDRPRAGQAWELSFGSAGVGSGSHFTGELFNVMAGVRLLHVPYGGSAQVMSDRRPRAGDVLVRRDRAAAG